MPRKTHRLASALGLSLALFAVGAAGQEGGEGDPVAALTEGNRLFRNGQIEAAIEAYRAGYSPGDPHPTLVYNLGAACHHLGRLPEAILWYRRAAGSEDPWLEENLWLARRSLGSQSLAPAGALGALAGHATLLRVVAVAIAWAALVVVLVWPRYTAWTLGIALAMGGSLYATAEVAERWGPRPAVLLQDCATSAGELPAGTEAWVRPLSDGGFRVAGSQITCPAESVELVFPVG